MSNQQEKYPITASMRKMYNGKQINYMYFHEDMPNERHIAVAYRYNLETECGEFCASIWHYNPLTDKGVKLTPFNRKGHRATAEKRLKLCKPVQFTLKFNSHHKVFYQTLCQKIRKTIRLKGVKGKRDGLTGTPASMIQPQITTGVKVVDIARASKRQRTSGTKAMEKVSMDELLFDSNWK